MTPLYSDCEWLGSLPSDVSQTTMETITGQPVIKLYFDIALSFTKVLTNRAWSDCEEDFSACSDTYQL